MLQTTAKKAETASVLKDTRDNYLLVSLSALHGAALRRSLPTADARLPLTSQY